LRLADCEAQFGKSASSVKRSIAEINTFLPEDRRIRIDDNQAVWKLSYTEYIRFIQSLTMDDYYSTQGERVTMMFTYSFFNLYLNMAGLYESLHISMTTKKEGQQGAVGLLEGTGAGNQNHPQEGHRDRREGRTVSDVDQHHISKVCGGGGEL